MNTYRKSYSEFWGLKFWMLAVFIILLGLQKQLPSLQSISSFPFSFHYFYLYVIVVHHQTICGHPLHLISVSFISRYNLFISKYKIIQDTFVVQMHYIDEFVTSNNGFLRLYYKERACFNIILNLEGCDLI